MIKTILFLIVLLSSSITYGWGVQTMMLGGGTPVAAGGCTGNETFRYHFENSFDVTVGTPTGCSAGDEVGTEAGTVTFETTSPSPQDGTYSALFDGTTDRLDFDISTRDIVTEVAGNFDFYFNLDTFTAGREMIGVSSTGNDHIVINLSGTDEIRLRYRGNGDTINLISTACNVTTGTWTHIIARYDSADVDPNLLLDCNDGTTVSDNTNLSAWAGVPLVLRIGDQGGSALQGNLDNLSIDNTFAD